MPKSCSKQATNRLPNGTFVFLPSHSFFLQKLCEENFFTTLFIFFFSLSNPFLPTQISSRKMPIEMPKGLPFSVDAWTPSSKRKRHHFSTHAHKDHSFGISSQFSFPIYSTLLTKTLVLQHYPQVCLCFQGFSFSFFSFFFFGLSLILWGLCSLMIHCLWKLKLGNRWLWMILMGLSLLRLLMPITVVGNLLFFFYSF